MARKMTFTVCAGWDHHFKGDLRFPEFKQVEAVSHYAAVKAVCPSAFPERIRDKRSTRSWYAQDMPCRRYITYRVNP